MTHNLPMPHSGDQIVIESIDRQTVGDAVRICAAITGVAPAQGSSAWFEVPSADADMLSDDVRPFVVGLVIPAMRRATPLATTAAIDPTLRHNLVEIQRIFSAWFPDRLARVPVRAPLSDAPPRRHGKGTGVFFSGGIDGMHAVLRASLEPVAGRDQSARVLIPVHGFDIPLTTVETFDYVVGAANRIAAELGWRVTPVRTNIKEEFYEPDRLVSWTTEGHGAALAATGHALTGRLQTVHVGATLTYAQHVPWGSHPLVDHLWSGAELDVAHIGADASRLMKIRELAGHKPGWLSLVRVCGSREVTPAPNCGRCEKCVRTALSALAVGALDLIAPSFRADVTNDLKALMPAVYSRSPFVIDAYFEIADELEQRPETSALGQWIRKQIRYLRPGPIHQAVRALDQSYLGGALDRCHSRLLHIMSRRQ